MTRAKLVLEYVRTHPGCTAVEIGRYLNVQHPDFGKQRAASATIACLRREGKLKDCPRCPYCLRATSRGQRNVPLYMEPSI